MPHAEPSRRALRFWKRLTDWYGARLVEQYGEEPPDDWCAAIDKASDRQVLDALTAIRSQHVQFPPSLPQLEQLLRPKYQAGPKKSPQEQLCEWVVANRALTPAQLRAVWTWLYTGSPYAGSTDFAIVGVVIPPDGEAPGHRIMLEDMNLEKAAA